MKPLALFFGLSAASLVVMVVVDFLLGAKAEFLNAYSVVQRLVGQVPSAGTSQIARQFGAIGEFVAVLLANLAIGGMLAALVRFFRAGAA